MTIQEAIQSGKPFKRRKWGKSWSLDCEWIMSLEEFELYIRDAIESSDDILATDWEVKE